MKRRTVLALLASGSAGLLVCGALLASNMAFRLNYQLARSGTATGTNTVALPWVPLDGIEHSGDLVSHMRSTGVPANSIERLEFWQPCTNTSFLYAGAGSDPPGLILQPGKGLWAKVSTDVSYLIVGAHDPSLEITFLGSNCGGTGTNLYAPPYHSAISDAGDLLGDINTNGTPANSVQRLEYWAPATNSRLLYSGTSTDPPAPQFRPGEAVFVKVGIPDVTYRPSHY